MVAPLTPDEIARATARTLDDYARRAQSFWEGTRDHDVRQNVDALLSSIEGPAPYTILDFGCGPGRDLATFTRLGHRAIGVERVAEFADMARRFSGCEVWQQDFLALDLPPSTFDGVFANASLFHVPLQELPRVLRELRASLKPRGVLFSSNPRGDDDEGYRGERFGVWHSLDGWRRHATAAGFVEVLHYYRPEGLPREQQPWLASVWRRVG